MSYEARMLKVNNMPNQREVEISLLKSLFLNGGIVKEFGSKVKIVEDLANEFYLDEKQRSVFLETIYKKENRIKKSNLWHRLLFRSANSLANKQLITRPKQTEVLTNKREWMLTEKGYDRVSKLLRISSAEKEKLPIKTFEVQKHANKISSLKMPFNYNPFEKKKVSLISKEFKIRYRGFRLAILDSYDFSCALCGLKLFSPNGNRWEVEAAHIVPHRLEGKDDIWNGISLCRLHHWAFDVGWFTIDDNFRVLTSSNIERLSKDLGRTRNYEFVKQLSKGNIKLALPTNKNHHPHPVVIRWHNEHIFCK
jgi:hypothetical protein